MEITSILQQINALNEAIRKIDKKKFSSIERDLLLEKLRTIYDVLLSIDADFFEKKSPTSVKENQPPEEEVMSITAVDDEIHGIESDHDEIDSEEDNSEESFDLYRTLLLNAYGQKWMTFLMESSCCYDGPILSQ